MLEDGNTHLSLGGFQATRRLQPVFQAIVPQNRENLINRMQETAADVRRNAQ